MRTGFEMFIAALAATVIVFPPSIANCINCNYYHSVVCLLVCALYSFFPSYLCIVFRFDAKCFPSLCNYLHFMCKLHIVSAVDVVRAIVDVQF